MAFSWLSPSQAFTTAALGVVLKEKLNEQPSILLIFEPAKKPVKGSSPEEACLSPLGLNGCCEALTA